MNISGRLQKELEIKDWQVEAVIKLIDEGNTIPFISRYRKEATGNLDDVILRKFDEKLRYYRNLDERRETIISSIEGQGKMTEDLRKKILLADTQVLLEDLYRPYKQKRRTRAMLAREKGLTGLAEYMMLPEVSDPIEKEALKYIDIENEVLDVDKAIEMAMDIIAEDISDNADLRSQIRNECRRESILISKATNEDAISVYENYYDYSEAVKTIPSHRILAINRGEKEKFLSVKLQMPEEFIILYLKKVINLNRNESARKYRNLAVEDAFKRLIAPSIENEIRSELTKRAEDSAIEIFKSNLHQLLMQAPIKGKTVLGWDPAFRTGCKLAVIDPSGKLLDTTVVFPTEPQNKVKECYETLKKLIKKYDIDLVSIGNGTASRESEQIISDFIKEYAPSLRYVIVNEAGASVYSASEYASYEMPDQNVGERSSASIARRLQDPMAELVKIEPSAIGVGQYQHDMNKKRLDETLENVVEDCVNHVGVDVNTASSALLNYISGLNKTVAENIVKYRDENGRFNKRSELKKVPRLGEKTFLQAAGFLRIHNGKEVLDNTSVHPESYKPAKALLKFLGFKSSDLQNGKFRDISSLIRDKSISIDELSKELGIGEYTLKDIIKELEKPGRDVRDSLPKPVLRSDVLSIDDLKEGMILKGTVRNIVSFGAFVDIGVHQDGLVHISQMSKRRVENPMDIVSLGDIVDVKILEIDKERNRIALSMKDC